MKDKIKDISIIIGFSLIALIFFICGIAGLYKSDLLALVWCIVGFLFLGCVFLIQKFGKRGQQT